YWGIFTLAELKLEPTFLIPKLANIIESSAPNADRAIAADFLCGYAPACSSALPSLVILLRSSDDICARAAMRAMKSIGDSARPALQNLLVSRDPHARKRAAETLDFIHQ